VVSWTGTDVPGDPVTGKTSAAGPNRTGIGCSRPKAPRYACSSAKVRKGRAGRLKWRCGASKGCRLTSTLRRRGEDRGKEHLPGITERARDFARARPSVHGMRTVPRPKGRPSQETAE
jgi:hypothetical protein